MKFFTIEWWSGIQGGDPNTPLNAFRAHLDSIRHRLPADLLLLQDSISLHDARLRELNLDTARETLTLNLDGDNGSGGLRRFSLTYAGVNHFATLSDPDLGLAGPNGYGDLGYDEPDVLDDGRLQHCLLFSSGIEFRIHFADFSLSYEDCG